VDLEWFFPDTYPDPDPNFKTFVPITSQNSASGVDYFNSAGIAEQSMGARNRIVIGLSII
jgi:hypothetical protein